MDARQANCLLRYSSDLEGASGNDMIMATCNQTLAPARGCQRSHLVMEARGRDVGRRRRPATRPAVPACLCVWANQQFSRGRLRSGVAGSRRRAA